MTTPRTLISKTLALFGIRHRDEELREEIDAHLESLAETHLQRGLTPQEARAAARREFGGVEQVKEAYREQRGLAFIESIAQDTRYGLRQFRRAPAFTCTVVLMLALGTGVNVAIFSIVQHALLRSLPVPAPEQLVNLSSPGPKAGSTSANGGLGGAADVFSYPLFRDLEQLGPAFTGVAAHREFVANVAFKGQASNETGWLVSGSYFPVLGIQPALGRLLTPSDDLRRGAHNVAVLSYDYWRTRFNSDPSVLGEPVVINAQFMTIVGVAPPDFVSTALDEKPRLFVPVSMAGLMKPDWNGFDDRRDHWLYLFARLAPGVTIENAERTINVPFAGVIRDVELPAQRGNLSPTARDEFARRRLDLTPGGQGQRPDRDALRRLALLLFCVTGTVLFMATANVANLLLARSVHRATELTVRMSIGAGRGRLVRQLLIESAILAGIGALAGAVLGAWALRLVTPLLPGAATFRFQFDSAMFIFVLLVSGGSTLLAGLYPALRSTRRTFSLRDSVSLVGAKDATRVRTVLTTMQVALSLTLLVLAGLFTTSLSNVTRVDLGIRPDGLLTFRISPELSGYTRERARALTERVERELSVVPGVAEVATSTIPLLDDFGWASNVTVERAAPIEESPFTADVGPGYFRTVGIPLLAGREFTAADSATTHRVAIVNQSFVRAFNLGPDVVGRRMGLGAGNTTPLDIEIVGIAQDARYSDVRTPPPAQFYLPYRQIQRFSAINLYVRWNGPAEPHLSAIRRTMMRIDPTIPIENLRTMNDQVRAAAASERSMNTLATAFAILAVVLAAVGLYGVLSYMVAQRQREFGVRMALGANPFTIRRLVIREVGRVALAGGIVEYVAAIALARLAQSMLFGIDRPDFRVFAGATAAVGAVIIVVALLPARRAGRVDPIVALRSE